MIVIVSTGRRCGFPGPAVNVQSVNSLLCKTDELLDSDPPPLLDDFDLVDGRVNNAYKNQRYAHASISVYVCLIDAFA